MSIVWTHKPIGWTPKECVDEYKRRTNDRSKIAFAGRLDPMAYGLLPLVINGTRSTAQELEGSYKTYQFKVVLGMTTDSYDILGFITRITSDNNTILSLSELDTMIDTCAQIKVQEYPPYSSKTVYDNMTKKQVQLWLLAKEGRLPTKLPEHPVDIEYIKLLKSKVVPIDDVVLKVTSRINALLPSIDMRRKEILQGWKEWQTKSSGREFQVIKCEAKVSCGTYIRSIGNMMDGVCYDISRTVYGDMTTKDLDKFEFALL